MRLEQRTFLSSFQELFLAPIQKSAFCDKMFAFSLPKRIKHYMGLFNTDIVLEVDFEHT